MTNADLEKYTVKVSAALQGTYRGRRIYTTQAPTSGPALLHMLNLMEKYDLKERNGLNVHRMIEAMKFGFASRSAFCAFPSFTELTEFRRTKICDPEYQNNTQVIKEMSTKAFADLIFPNITDARSSCGYYGPTR